MVKIQFSILSTNTFSFPLLEDSGPWGACNGKSVYIQLIFVKA